MQRYIREKTKKKVSISFARTIYPRNHLISSSHIYKPSCSALQFCLWWLLSRCSARLWRAAFKTIHKTLSALNSSPLYNINMPWTCASLLSHCRIKIHHSIQQNTRIQPPKYFFNTIHIFSMHKNGVLQVYVKINRMSIICHCPPKNKRNKKNE